MDRDLRKLSQRLQFLETLEHETKTTMASIDELVSRYSIAPLKSSFSTPKNSDIEFGAVGGLGGSEVTYSHEAAFCDRDSNKHHMFTSLKPQPSELRDHKAMSKSSSVGWVENMPCMQANFGDMSKPSAGWVENIPGMLSKPVCAENAPKAEMYQGCKSKPLERWVETQPAASPVFSTLPHVSNYMVSATRPVMNFPLKQEQQYLPSQSVDQRATFISGDQQQLQQQVPVWYNSHPIHPGTTWNCSTQQERFHHEPFSAQERFPGQPVQVMYDSQTPSVEKTPTFNGKNNLQDFLIQFECLSTMRRWSQQLKGQKLLLALEGQATSVLGTLPEHQRMNYDSLKQALQKRFQPKLDPDIAGTLYQNRRKKQNESYLGFAQDLRKLIIAAHPDWPEECIEGMTREKFFNSLNDTQIKGLIWSKSPKSVEEAAEMADNLERMIDLTNDQTVHFRSNCQDKPRNKQRDQKERNSRDNDSNESGHHTRQNDQQGEPSGRSGGRQQNGYSARRNDSNNGNRSKKANILCYACREYGHYSNECPTKNQRNDQNQPENF